MKKLPPGEAKRRHEERNRLANEKRKAERLAGLEAAGKPLFKTLEQQRARIRENQRKRRAQLKALETPALKVVNQLKLAKSRKSNSSPEMPKRRALRKVMIENLPEQDKAIYKKIRAAKAYDEKKPPLPDLRTKEHRTKPNRIPKPPTITKTNPVKMQSKALPPLAPKRKPKAQAAICRIPVTPVSHTKTWIPELKMHVYIKPGQTVDQVIAKYSQRPGAKIVKW